MQILCGTAAVMWEHSVGYTDKDLFISCASGNEEECLLGEINMKKLLSLLLAMAMVLSMTACTSAPAETTTTPAETTSAPIAGVPFTVIVTDVDGTENTFQYTSEAATVGEALLAEGLISGDESEYGLYITSVNGITADWTTENAYWAFYINGEYAETGVDATPITEGAVYSLTKTISYTPMGEGAATFYLVVRDLDGTAASFEIHTDAETVGEALLALELIEGEVGDYGLYINSVNGITADWDTEQAYWAFYVNGEYAQTGVDTTPVMEGAAYELVKTNS